MSHRKSLQGERFGMLVVKEQTGKNRFGHSLWLCECDCGQTREILYQHLVPGKGKPSTLYSCGCTRRPTTKL